MKSIENIKKKTFYDEISEFYYDLIDLIKEDWRKSKLFISQNKSYFIWICILVVTMQITDIFSLGQSWDRVCKSHHIQHGGALPAPPSFSAQLKADQKQAKLNMKAAEQTAKTEAAGRIQAQADAAKQAKEDKKTAETQKKEQKKQDDASRKVAEAEKKKADKAFAATDEGKQKAAEDKKKGNAMIKEHLDKKKAAKEEKKKADADKKKLDADAKKTEKDAKKAAKGAPKTGDAHAAPAAPAASSHTVPGADAHAAPGAAPKPGDAHAAPGAHGAAPKPGDAHAAPGAHGNATKPGDAHATLGASGSPEDAKKAKGEKAPKGDKPKGVKSSISDSLKSSPIFGHLDKIFGMVESMVMIIMFILIVIGILSVPVIMLIVATYCIIKFLCKHLALL